MTIAGFYLTAEGVVLGADSTASTNTPDGAHFFNFNQKLFEVGEQGTLGLVTWGAAGFGSKSIRTLVADLGEQLSANPVQSVNDAALAFVGLAWPVYSADPLVQLCKTLNSKPAHDPANAGNAANRTADEEKQLASLRHNLVAGFCLGGYVKPSRKPAIAEIIFDPLQAAPTPTVLDQPGSTFWWGAPNLVHRLVQGVDQRLRNDILASGRWNGQPAELDNLLQNYRLFHPVVLPIRDAIDYVHSCIYSTIKGLKFSPLAQICGGPIELAVLTTDRPFRWVRHKAWDAAITEG